MAPRRVVALISGGKDSIYSAMHCAANSHQVVALANLYPSRPSVEGEDIDSYMYQTVGHSIVPLYAQALGIPLYRRQIKGAPIVIDQGYGANAPMDDETEDLIPLLQEVLGADPTIDAVCTGAILSTYQRTRIESVAIRLGLIPLSYLWQYPYLPPASHISLLLDMAAAGLDARLVKVASGGLDQEHLWLNAASRATAARLLEDMHLLGQLDVGAVIGEGGEFETLCIDGPAPFWKQRIDLQCNKHRGEAGSSFVICTDAHLLSKPTVPAVQIKQPSLWDEQSCKIFDSLKAGAHTQGHQSTRSLHEIQRRDPKSLSPAVRLGTHLLNISNQHVVQERELREDGFKETVRKLDRALRQADFVPDDVELVTVILRSMSDFPLLNDTYSHLFTQPLPPARITIACGELLPSGVNVSLSCVARRSRREPRQGLHVQSVSYWAPANIGPYSQSITSPLHSAGLAVVYVAGQIPLTPASMELLDDSFEHQAMLAFQHMTRIGRCQAANLWTSAAVYIVAKTPGEAYDRSGTALAIWEAAHQVPRKESEAESINEDFDIAEAYLRQPWATKRVGVSKSIATIQLSPLPDMSRVSEGSVHAPCFVAEVAELPRGAPVEWAGLGLSIDTSLSGLAMTCKITSSAEGAIRMTISPIEYCFGMAALRGSDGYERLTKFWGTNATIEQVEAWITENTPDECQVWLDRFCAQVVPCKSLWSRQGQAHTIVRWRECPS